MSEPEYRPPSNPIAPEEGPAIIFRNPQEFVLPPAPPKAPRSPLWWILSLLVMVCVAGTLAQPAYLRVEDWRSRQLSLASLQLLDSGMIPQAADKARAAYELSSRPALTLRAMAKTLDAQEFHKEAFSFWQQLAAPENALSEDQRGAIDAALRAKNVPAARAALDALLRRSARVGNPANMIMAARVKFAEGNVEDAVLEARYALKRTPDDEPMQFLFAEMLLAGNPEAHTEGLQMLRDLSDNHTMEGLRALRLLAADAKLAPDRMEWVAERIDEHPLATPRDRLKALELNLRAHPRERATLIAAATPRYQNAAPELFTAYGRVLLAVKEPLTVLTLFPGERAMSRATWIILHLDALAQLQRWQEVYDLLLEPTIPLPKFHVALFKARALDALARPAEALTAWQQAFDAAQGNFETLQLLADYAEQMGNSAQAQRARAQLPVP